MSVDQWLSFLAGEMKTTTVPSSSLRVRSPIPCACVQVFEFQVNAAALDPPSRFLDRLVTDVPASACYNNDVTRLAKSEGGGASVLSDAAGEEYDSSGHFQPFEDRDDRTALSRTPERRLERRTGPLTALMV